MFRHVGSKLARHQREKKQGDTSQNNDEEIIQTSHGDTANLSHFLLCRDETEFTQMEKHPHPHDGEEHGGLPDFTRAYSQDVSEEKPVDVARPAFEQTEDDDAE